MATIVAGTGHDLPPRVVTNAELEARLEIEPGWIENRTGILERRYIAPGDSVSKLAARAARIAMREAGWEAGDVDAIIFATLSPEMTFPGSGVFLQRELGLAGVPALDVRNQCSGFLYGLSIADGWLARGRYGRVLLVGAEVHSTSLDFRAESKGVTSLFGDGAGAVALEWEDSERGLIDVRLGADGNGAESLFLELPSSSRHPSISSADLDAGRQYPQMSGRAVFRGAVEVLTKEMAAMLADHGVDEDVLVVPHQANQRLNELVAKNLGFPPERVVHTIAGTGNTTAASLPLTLDIARRDGRVEPGQLVLMAAFGSGYTWGTALIRF